MSCFSHGAQLWSREKPHRYQLIRMDPHIQHRCKRCLQPMPVKRRGVFILPRGGCFEQKHSWLRTHAARSSTMVRQHVRCVTKSPQPTARLRAANLDESQHRTKAALLADWAIAYRQREVARQKFTSARCPARGYILLLLARVGSTMSSSAGAEQSFGNVFLRGQGRVRTRSPGRPWTRLGARVLTALLALPAPQNVGHLQLTASGVRWKSPSAGVTRAVSALLAVRAQHAG